MYSHIRHPFYLSLAVAGFGLLTIWPRIIILVLYLGMLFLPGWVGSDGFTSEPTSGSFKCSQRASPPFRALTLSWS
jgi:protein-S-isoprenylcysteine O-methyltransferase Ste14